MVREIIVIVFLCPKISKFTIKYTATQSGKANALYLIYPLKSSEKREYIALVVPQVGHLTPNSFLKGQPILKK